ncbi:hypothetical protein ACWC2T_45950 [Streptomyces sp. NPDC001393]
MSAAAMLGEGREAADLVFAAVVEAAVAGESGHGAFDGHAVAARSLGLVDPSAGHPVSDASRRSHRPSWA